jgi:peptide/nickel transport system permease protein
MIRFLAQRLMHGLVVIFGVVLVVFVVTRLIGNPVAVMLPIDASAAEKAALAAKLGLDRPILTQFVDYLSGLLRFDMGNSLWQDRPAMAIVGERIGHTLALVGAAIVTAIAIGLPLGLVAATRAGRFLDRFTVTASLAGLSMPQFWLGMMLIMLFAVELRWLPSSGADTAWHVVLPALALALPSAARIVMLTRSQMIDELNQPYVRTAEAKGLAPARVVGVHALRNAANPILTLVGWEAIRMLAGYTVVVETVFAWPGLGFLAIQSIERQDLVLLQAVVFVVALMVVAVNLAIDLVYKAVDPRVKLG